MAFDKLQSLMAEIGPLLDLAEVVAFAQHRLWTLAFDDGQVVEVETDAAGSRVLFSIEVAPAVPDESLRLMLQFNQLWQQTGGLHFALGGEVATLMLELPVDMLDAPLLATALGNLHDRGAQWRRLLGASPTAPQGGDELPTGALRV